MAERRRRKSQPTGQSKKVKPSLDLFGTKNDEHIDSSSDEEEDSFAREPSLEEESEDEEPLETKRVRLAREYLEKLEGESADSSSQSEGEDENDEQDHISRKLQKARQKKEGTYEREMAEKVREHVDSLKRTFLTETQQAWIESGLMSQLRGHDLTVTCVALSGENKAVSGSKDHSVLLWDVEKKCRVATICQHWKKSAGASNDKAVRTSGQVQAVACSDDGRYAAVGRRDATVQIFDIRAKSTYNLVHTFAGHKGPVTCLAFQSFSNNLFSGGDDRCVRHYNLDEMMYLETLYGHQFGVTAIDCLAKERPISVGKDRTARAWKLVEDTHLIFRGGSKIQAAECISLIKDEWFLTGHQDGNLSLWLTEKKKATVTVGNAHGVDAGIGRPVVSVASLRSSDLAASGSCDGSLRFWSVQTGARLQERLLEPAFEVPLEGYVNAVAFGAKAKFCVAAVGQEHRNGRWARIPGAKNRLAIIDLRNPNLSDDAENDDDVASTMLKRDGHAYDISSDASSNDGSDNNA